MTESILPESDDDAVRILTIHGAKGLEFPITIVSGMSTAPSGRRAPAEVVFPATGGVGYRFGNKVRTDDYVDWAPIDEQMGLHERIRLMYVACTRARDHLIVSLHRKARAKPPSPRSRTNAELLLDGMGDVVDDLPDGGGDPGRASSGRRDVSFAPAALRPMGGGANGCALGGPLVPPRWPPPR